MIARVRSIVDQLSLRRERIRRLAAARQAARDLRLDTDRTAGIGGSDAIVAVSVMRNEVARVEGWLSHYRGLGVHHFLIVDNGSTDGTTAILRGAADVSLWTTEASYRAARYGTDWVNWLCRQHASGHWVVVADADELLVYPHYTTRPLGALTRTLERDGRESFGTVLVDLYASRPAVPGQRPDLQNGDLWFDPLNYTVGRHHRYHNLWVQGGPRARAFFAGAPMRSPALNKIPLVRWRSGHAFLTSTHNLLPRRLNRVYDRTGPGRLSGALLHTKLLGDFPSRVAEELRRREHYDHGSEYRAYAAGGAGRLLWTPQSVRFDDWRQLCGVGLMSGGAWAG